MPPIRVANARLNAHEYDQRLLALASLPPMVYVELTQNCNAACHMCRSAGQYEPRKNMSDELFDSVVCQLFPTAHLIDLRGWGESTILPDFGAKLFVTATSGARLRLVTNGLAMPDDAWEVFWRSGGSVAVSVDSADPDTFARMGRGDLRRVFRNVREGAQRLRQIGSGQLYFIAVVSSFNLTGLPSIVEAAAALGVPRVVLIPVKGDDGAVARTDYLAPSLLRRSLDAACDAGRACGVVVQLSGSLHPDLTIADALPLTCPSPWSHAVVSYNGEVLFCDHLINRFEYSIGNLRDASFSDLWNGPRMIAIRRAHLEAETSRRPGPGLSKCAWCYLSRYADVDTHPELNESKRDVRSDRDPHLYR